jgi:hypothetical protein
LQYDGRYSGTGNHAGQAQHLPHIHTIPAERAIVPAQAAIQTVAAAETGKFNDPSHQDRISAILFTRGVRLIPQIIPPAGILQIIYDLAFCHRSKTEIPFSLFYALVEFPEAAV